MREGGDGESLKSLFSVEERDEYSAQHFCSRPRWPPWINKESLVARGKRKRERMRVFSPQLQFRTKILKTSWMCSRWSRPQREEGEATNPAGGGRGGEGGRERRGGGGGGGGGGGIWSKFKIKQEHLLFSPASLSWCSSNVSYCCNEGGYFWTSYKNIHSLLLFLRSEGKTQVVKFLQRRRRPDLLRWPKLGQRQGQEGTHWSDHQKK